MDNLTALMTETGIPSLSGEMLPEFKERVAILSNVYGERLFVSDIELVKRQGVVAGVVELVSREDWLASLGQRIVQRMSTKVTEYISLLDLVRAHFGELWRDYHAAIVMDYDFMGNSRWFLLKFGVGFTAWCAMPGTRYRLATDTESRILYDQLKKLNSLPDHKEIKHAA